MGTRIEIRQSRDGMQALYIYDGSGNLACIIHRDTADGSLYGHVWLDSIKPVLMCRLQESTAKDILRAVLPFQKEPEQC